MKVLIRSVLVAASLSLTLVLSACQKPQDILQTLQAEVSAYAAKPSDEAAAKIEADFQRLDEQIAQLRQNGRTAEADGLAQQKSALQTQFLAARMTASLLKAKEAAQGIGEAFRKAGEAFGQTIKDGAGEGQ